jgi:hypothetical protein
MERYNARKRLKSARRRDCPKTPLRSFARALANTPGLEMLAATPSRVALVRAAREWLARKAAV